MGTEHMNTNKKLDNTAVIKGLDGVGVNKFKDVAADFALTYDAHKGTFTATLKKKKYSPTID